jgi:hypothetical protein
MNNYFETSVRYEKTSEEGKIVSVTEKYIVDALSFTEAEARIIKEMEPFISGSFQVSSIRKLKINEIMYAESGDKWFKVRVVLSYIDEEKGKEKRIPATVYVNANDIESVRGVVVEGMKESMVSWEIESIMETKIIELFKYES